MMDARKPGADGPGAGTFPDDAEKWLAERAGEFWDGASVNSLDPDTIRRAIAWQRELFDAGWAGLAVPASFGGAGRTHQEDIEFQRLEAKYVPLSKKYALTIGLHIVVPAIVAYGNSYHRPHVPAILKGDELWCQLFSEPEAGSDLTAARLRAQPSLGGGYVLNGQKIWTSKAQIADFGLLVARTGSVESGRRGLSCFIVDMRLPGITIRPIEQLTGLATFCEVFFDDVQIDQEALLGQPDQGWEVIRTTLAWERRYVGVRGLVSTYFQALTAEVAKRPTSSDALLRNVAEIYVQEKTLAAFLEMLESIVSAGNDPGPLASIAKILASRLGSRAGVVGMELLGAAAMLLPEELPQANPVQYAYLSSIGSRIGGGTDNMHLNAIADRLLGLPRG
jgi:alkylation response protein AidB-like acyl-CoA dehydrogenase